MVLLVQPVRVLVLAFVPVPLPVFSPEILLPAPVPAVIPLSFLASLVIFVILLVSSHGAVGFR